MTNDTPTTTVTPKQAEILATYVYDHNDGRHQERPRSGCAGCLLSGALEGENSVQRRDSLCTSQRH